MTSGCKEYQKQIPELFVDGLNKEERQGLEEHLAECANCLAEHESYARTIDLMKFAEAEPAPRHFFVYPKEERLNPWQLFRRMPLRWQAATVTVISALLLMGVAAVSDLHIKSDHNGWNVGFGGDKIDIAALKDDILREADAKNREARIVWINEIRGELARSVTNLTQKQEVELTTALQRMDDRFSRRLLLAEDNMRADSHQIAGDVYQVVSQRRAQDMDIISFRLDTIEASNRINARQTDTILGTLLQEAELRLR